jgi:hypothetical protein
MPELNEALGVTVGQWTEQDSVDDAERGCRPGNAKAKREDGDRSEARGSREATEGGANLGSEGHQDPI